MTPSQQAKSHGHTTLADVARIAGILPDTLRKYHSTKPRLFEAICRGTIEMKGVTNEND
jgi:AcrR family transcriptional regulator